MHTGSLKKWALALTFWLALHTSPLRAQLFTNNLPLQAVTTGTNPVDFEFRADGTLIAKGNYGVGSLLTADLGAGTRMLWFPSLGAFRAGGVGGSQWDTGNIGPYSVAFGLNSTASGYQSIAMAGGTASGSDSLALGTNSIASGPYAVSLGGYTTSSNYGTLATGLFSTASGYYSTAQGYQTTASGHYAVSEGQYTSANGWWSSASGYCTQAPASYSFVIGAFNLGLNADGVSAPNPTIWVPTDPLFEIGNGSSPEAGISSLEGTGNPYATGLSDAFVVYKNGNAVLQGTLQVAPGGDIPMYTGN